MHAVCISQEQMCKIFTIDATPGDPRGNCMYMFMYRQFYSYGPE